MQRSSSGILQALMCRHTLDYERKCNLDQTPLICFHEDGSGSPTRALTRDNFRSETSFPCPTQGTGSRGGTVERQLRPSTSSPSPLQPPWSPGEQKGWRGAALARLPAHPRARPWGTWAMAPPAGTAQPLAHSPRSPGTERTPVWQPPRKRRQRRLGAAAEGRLSRRSPSHQLPVFWALYQH